MLLCVFNTGGVDVIAPFLLCVTGQRTVQTKCCENPPGRQTGERPSATEACCRTTGMDSNYVTLITSRFGLAGEPLVYAGVLSKQVRTM